MKYLIVALHICLFSNFAFGETTIDSVIVKKSEKKMYLCQKEKIIKEYKVSFGANPKGHKQQEGDERTPEGHYILDYKKVTVHFIRLFTSLIQIKLT